MQDATDTLIEAYKEELCNWRQMLTEDDIPTSKLAFMVEELVKQKLAGNHQPKMLTHLRSLVEHKLNRITNHSSTQVGQGNVWVKIDYADGASEEVQMRNTLLEKGKEAIAKSLANDVSDPYDFYINSMLFGTNGTSGGTPKYVDSSRTGLFGTTLLTKNVIASIDTAAPKTAIFTSVIKYDEAVGQTLNEMALRMQNGELYSMLTFPDLNKTSQQQLTFNWSISFL